MGERVCEQKQKVINEELPKLMNGWMGGWIDG